MYTTASRVNSSEQVKLPPREKVEIPKLKEGEETKDYVCAIHKNSPFETVTISGLNFEKFVLDPAFSEVGNKQKSFEHRYIVRAFSDAQVKAMKKAIDRHKKLIRSGTTRTIIKTSDYIIFKEKKDFNPGTDLYEVQKPTSFDEEFEEGMIDAQIAKAKKKGK